MAIHLKQCIFRLGPYLKIIYEHNQQIGGQYTKENVQACDFLGNKFFLLHFISLKVKVWMVDLKQATWCKGTKSF